MKKKSAEEKSVLLKSYLWILLILLSYSVLNILASLIMDRETFEYFEFLGILDIIATFGMLVFSIYCLIVFIKRKFRRITFVLPVWYMIEIISVSSFVIISIILVLLRNTIGQGMESILASSVIVILNLVNNLAQFGFTIYLLNKINIPVKKIILVLLVTIIAILVISSIEYIHKSNMCDSYTDKGCDKSCVNDSDCRGSACGAINQAETCVDRHQLTAHYGLRAVECQNNTCQYTR